MLLLIWQNPELAAQGESGSASPGQGEASVEEVQLPVDAAESIEQATRTVGDLWLGFLAMLPRLVVALLFIGVALLIGNLIHLALRRSLGSWERSDAIAALARIVIFLIALGAALSVLAGDARALVGSVGLAGLALSWALQTPIESFTGWLLNSMRGYYRVGDRIEVGEVFGDVYRIDVLTTTVWEAGGPGKPVAGAQATGAMITFPNWEVLRNNIVNYSREFPYVWDEISVGVDDRSDLVHTRQTLEATARAVLGGRMNEPADQYRRLLERARIAFDIPQDPQVYLTLEQGWTNMTIRYLVPVLQRRRWSSDLALAVSLEMAKPEHAGKIIPGVPAHAVHLRAAQTADQPAQ